MRESHLSELEKVCEGCRRTLEDPRSRLRGTGHWLAAAQSVLSVQCVAWLILMEADKAVSPEHATRLRKLVGFFEDAIWNDGSLIRLRGVYDLVDFAAMLRESSRDQSSRRKATK